MTEASAFAAWLDHTRSSQQNRSKVQGSVMRLLHRSLCSAFAAWQQVAADRAQQKAKILSCLARISNRASLCLCLTWSYSEARLHIVSGTQLQRWPACLDLTGSCGTDTAPADALDQH